MRKILRIVKREYLTAVKTKGFIIALFVMPVVMGGSGIAMALFSGQVDTADKIDSRPGSFRSGNYDSDRGG